MGAGFWPPPSFIMIVTPERITSFKLPQSPRTSGIHLSNIIRNIAIETGILKQEILEDLALTDNYREITDIVALLRISLGLAWEEWYIENLLPEVADHPGEMCRDGVYMNCDGESVSVLLSPVKHILHKVHEIKATYKSEKTVGDLSDYKKNWMWNSQLMAYCLAKNTNEGDLHVLFFNSDYKFPLQPSLIVYHCEYTQQELDDNWDLLHTYKRERM